MNDDEWWLRVICVLYRHVMPRHVAGVRGQIPQYTPPQRNFLMNEYVKRRPKKLHQEHSSWFHSQVSRCEVSNKDGDPQNSQETNEASNLSQPQQCILTWWQSLRQKEDSKNSAEHWQSSSGESKQKLLLLILTWSGELVETWSRDARLWWPTMLAKWSEGATVTVSHTHMSQSSINQMK